MAFEYDRKWLAQLRQGVDRLEKGWLRGWQLVPERTFQELDDSARAVRLKSEFEKLLIAAAVNMNGNLYALTTMMLRRVSNISRIPRSSSASPDAFTIITERRNRIRMHLI